MIATISSTHTHGESLQQATRKNVNSTLLFSRFVFPRFGDTTQHSKLPLVKESPIHLVHEVPLITPEHPNGWEKGIFSFVPENIFGTEKYEVCAKRGGLVHDHKKGKPRYVLVGYPGIYGYLPQTLSLKTKGGDGDSLDVLVLGLNKATMGKPFTVRILGALDMREIDKKTGKEEQDLKIIALPMAKGQNFKKIKTIDDLNKKHDGVLEILKAWFTHYKRKDGLICKGILSFEETMAVIKKSYKDWQPEGEVYKKAKPAGSQLSASA